MIARSVLTVAIIVASGCLMKAQRLSANWPRRRGPSRDGVIEPSSWATDSTLFSLSNRNAGQHFGLDGNDALALGGSSGQNTAIARAGTLLFSLEDDGDLLVARSSQTAFTPFRRYKVADSETWAQPIISGNRIFVKDVSTLALWTLN